MTWRSCATSCRSWCTETVAADLVVLYEDDALLVLDKPAGLLSVPGRGEDKQDCLSIRAQAHRADALVVHRLDMATSGLMLMARGKLAQQTLSRAFAKRQVNKTYVALVHGRLAATPRDAWGVINLAIALDWPNRPRSIVRAEGGRASTTRWRVLSAPDTSHTRVELEPVTGRSHQLRVHMLAIGHPIVGDQLYTPPSMLDGAARLMLHATHIGFAHPVTARLMVFSSAPDF